MTPIHTPIHVISMANSADRRAEFADAARGADLSWSFFDAATTLPADLTYDDAQARRDHGRPLKPGELGCYASHYLLWQRLLASEEAQMVVLEDDVIVDWNALAAYADMDLFAEGIDYLRLYGKHPVKTVVRRQNFGFAERFLVQLFGRPAGTQGYIVTRRGAAAFADYCQRVSRPIDVQMDRYWDHGVPDLAVFPYVLLERAIPSTIGDTRYQNEHADPEFRRQRKTDRRRRKLYNLKTRLQLKLGG